MGGGLVDSTQRLRRGWAQPSDAAESPPRLWGDCRSRLVRTHCTSSTFARAVLQPSGRSISSDRVTRERHNRAARPRQFTFGFLVRVGGRLVFRDFSEDSHLVSLRRKKTIHKSCSGVPPSPTSYVPLSPSSMDVRSLPHVLASSDDRACRV